MSDYTELKRLATRIVEVQTSQDVPISKLFDDFDAATSPEVVLALIAETEELGRYLCTCRDCGGEGALHTGGWHSYGHMEPPDPVMEKCGECDGTGLIGEIQDLYQVITERDQLKAENEALRKDAERYRWLRGRDLETLHVGGVFAGQTPRNVVLNGVDLDSAIDEAMGKGEQS